VLLTGIDWVLLVAVMAAAAVLAAVAFGRRGNALPLVAAGLLAVGIVLAALPGVVAPLPVTIAVAAAAIVAAVLGGDPVTRLALTRTTFDDEEGAHGGVLDRASGRELLRGGRVIGLLERLAVAGAIVAGFPEALAVIIAIKGVGRFSELENGAVRERFIVGTLASWIWAAAAASVVLLTRT
jgi:hypothetical protein